MLGLSQFDKGLAVKETDIAKFYKFENGKTVYNDRHPEIETFKNGIGRFIEWACAHGIDNRMAVKMGAKAFYAAAAADLDRPVAMNTTDRDKKIASDAVRKKLAPFLKGNSGGTLNVAGGNAAQNRTAEPALVHGFNAEKLAEDPAYLREMYAKYAFDPDMLDKLGEAASVGRGRIEKRSNGRR
jgi:hypothetical protein